MLRIARWVIPGGPHHATRARHRPPTGLLLPAATGSSTLNSSAKTPPPNPSAFWLTPLLTNHIHLIVIPPEERLPGRRSSPRPLLAMPNTSTRWKIITSGPPSATSNETRVRAGLVASPADREWSGACATSA